MMLATPRMPKNVAVTCKVHVVYLADYLRVYKGQSRRLQQQDIVCQCRRSRSQSVLA